MFLKNCEGIISASKIFSLSFCYLCLGKGKGCSEWKTKARSLRRFFIVSCLIGIMLDVGCPFYFANEFSFGSGFSVFLWFFFYLFIFYNLYCNLSFTPNFSLEYLSDGKGRSVYSKMKLLFAFLSI